ncbi:MAG: hypothetical protein ACJ75F_12350 [Flavisolibacter sp.]
MKWNAVPGIACLLSFMLPVAVIIYNRYYTHRSLAALLTYYIFSAINIIMVMDLLSLPASFRNNFILTSVYLAVPIVLSSLLFFCPNKPKQRIVNFLILSFISYEILITAFYGFNTVTAGYILGPGLLLILGHSAILFARQVKFTIMHGKNQGRTLMLSSMLFAYACYILIYYFYFIQKTPDTADTVLLYFISSFITAIIMAWGLHLMRKRMRELRSLRITRKELALFFSN